MSETIEQFCRDLLDKAISESIVAPDYHHWDDPSPQARSSGELVSIANMVVDELAALRTKLEIAEKSIAQAMGRLTDESAKLPAKHPQKIVIDYTHDDLSDALTAIRDEKG